MEYFDTSNFKGPVKVLQNGEVLALPTETVYGLAVRADSKAAFDRLVATKNRNPDKPFALAFDCLASALPYLEIDKRAKAVMEKFLPGQLTVLVKAKKHFALARYARYWCCRCPYSRRSLCFAFASRSRCSVLIDFGQSFWAANLKNV